MEKRGKKLRQVDDYEKEAEAAAKKNIKIRNLKFKRNNFFLPLKIGNLTIEICEEIFQIAHWILSVRI